MQESVTIDKEDVHFEDDVLVPLDNRFWYVLDLSERWGAGPVGCFALEVGDTGPVY